MTNKHIGEIWETRHGEKYEIISYNRYSDVLIRFLDTGAVKHTAYSCIKNGSINNPFRKSVLGIGYIGDDSTVTKIDGKKKRSYNTWLHMMHRCYNNKEHIKRPTYIGCSVCDEWHSYYEFSKWYDAEYYEVEGEETHLDKDILVKGNKVYSPETCVFVPSYINNLFTIGGNSRGDTLIGTHRTDDGTYVVHCGGEYYGCYKTEQEAYQVYKLQKELLIKETAERYRNVIPVKLYNALVRYVVEQED